MTSRSVMVIVGACPSITDVLSVLVILLPTLSVKPTTNEAALLIDFVTGIPAQVASRMYEVAPATAPVKLVSLIRVALSAAARYTENVNDALGKLPAAKPVMTGGSKADDPLPLPLINGALSLNAFMFNPIISCSLPAVLALPIFEK